MPPTRSSPCYSSQEHQVQLLEGEAFAPLPTALAGGLSPLAQLPEGCSGSSAQETRKFETGISVPWDMFKLLTLFISAYNNTLNILIVNYPVFSFCVSLV